MIDKIFPRKLNRSKDARIQDKTEMYNAINISIDDFDGNFGGADGTGDAGVIKPSKGNAAVLQPGNLLSDSQHMRVLGSVSDEVNNELYLFVFSTVASEHGVYKVNSAEVLERVFTSEHFNFQQNGFVKGDIVYRQNGDVILYFTDGFNEPRKLNMGKLSQEQLEDITVAAEIDFITACPKTPMHPPTFNFVSDPAKPVNFRSVEGFQFAYQCLYSTGEESAISTYSNIAVPPVYLTQGSLPDANLEANNLIRVSIPRVVNEIENYTSNIEKIRLLVRIGNNGGFFTVAEKYAADNLTFDFYNDSILTGVPEEDQDKLNDALPRAARGQTIVNDRLIYGNYQEGYETPTVKASFTTVNNPRPADFVDLSIGIIPLISPAFKEDIETISVNFVPGVDLSQNSFVPSQNGSPNKVFNRRSSYQFDLSSLPSELPEGAIAEISFSMTPDGNFELYNSENSFHTFKNNGFGLSAFRPDEESISTSCKTLVGNAYSTWPSGSPAVFQNNIGVQQNGISWESTDAGVEGSVSDVRFGTSPSNPFIIPSEFVKFKVRFKLEQTISGDNAVRNTISDVLKTYFSDESTVAPEGVTFFVDGGLADAIEGQNDTVSVNQLFNNPEGYGLIPDNDPRARTVISCFSASEYSASDSVAPVGFFAINKADVTFGLRFSEKVNANVVGDYDRGPIFSLHVKDIDNVETVTMIPRITRSGARGWIYFTKEFLQDPLNQDNVRKICVFDQPTIPEITTYEENPLDEGVEKIKNDLNIFFLNRHFCPIAGPYDRQSTVYANVRKILPTSFLNASGVEVVTNPLFNSPVNAFRGFQGIGEPYLIDDSNVPYIAYPSEGNTELDSDFRVIPGTSQYPSSAIFSSFGEPESGSESGLDLDHPTKRRIIGYLELNGEKPIRIADPNSDTTDTVYSIIDGEANIRNRDGRLNPSFWYGLYYGTEYAGRNNNQFLLSEGSDSDEPVGLIHGQFNYKSFESSEAQAKINALIPDIELGPKSFTLITDSLSSGAVGRSFKRNCDHSFALLYYDERGRPGEPVPLGSHFVRQVANPGLANIVLNIDSDYPPPEWAHSYKVLYGGNNSVSDFIQYTAGGAFVPKNSDVEQGVIYVSLNYLQENSEVSYSKAFGAVRYDGDKDLYTFSEGDRLRIISYFDDADSVQYPQINKPFEFQVIGTVTLNDDALENPLAVEGDEVHPAKTGQFVILKDNPDATGFSFADVAGSNSDANATQLIYDPDNFWNRRCVFEIFSPQKKREVESRVYYEIGDTYNVVRGPSGPTEGAQIVPLHQTTSILLDQGDVYFRKMAVNMPDFDALTDSFLGLIGNGTNTPDELTSPNFRSYHLESKTFTDLFPSTDVLPYGKPRVAIQKVQPVRDGNFAESSGSSNFYSRKSSIKFSDRSSANSNIVRYTSFNDSKLPFKDLQINDGEIFFLENYNDSIFCIQRLKCSSIPVSRNILADALGNENVIATSKVLGTEKYYAGAFGTDAPESVAKAGSALYFVSVRNKEVYRFSPSSGIEVISDKGMASFFDDLLSGAELSTGARIVGGYDPDADEFILSVWESVIPLISEGVIPFSNEVETLLVQDVTDFEGAIETGGGDVGGEIDELTDEEIFQAGFEAGQDSVSGIILNAQDIITELTESVSTNTTKLDVLTKSLFLLSNLIDVLNNSSSDDVINVTSSISDFIDSFDVEDIDLIEGIDLAYSANAESPNNVSLILDMLSLYGDAGENPSAFRQLMSQAIVLAQGSVLSDEDLQPLYSFLTGNPDFLVNEAFVSSSNMNRATNPEEDTRNRVEAISQIAEHISGIIPSTILFEGSGAAGLNLNPGDLLEWLKSWVTIGLRINEQVGPGTIDLSPTSPQELLDSNTTITFVNESSETLGQITFDQLLNIFRRGLISKDQAKLIFTGLKGDTLLPQGGTKNLVYVLDVEGDQTIGSYDFLKFLSVFGQDFGKATDNFQPFQNVAFGEEYTAAGGFTSKSVNSVENTEDSAPFADEDSEIITGFT
jgi:hypothetical protein